jgi:hypothetical protein
MGWGNARHALYVIWFLTLFLMLGKSWTPLRQMDTTISPSGLTSRSGESMEACLLLSYGHGCLLGCSKKGKKPKCPGEKPCLPEPQGHDNRTHGRATVLALR